MTKAEEIQLRARAIVEIERRKLRDSLHEFLLHDGEGEWQTAKHLRYIISKLEKFVQDVKDKKSPI